MTLKGSLKDIFFLSSLNVVAAAGVCTWAFFKLSNPLPEGAVLSLLQVMSVCWLVYILDRLLDINRLGFTPDTERHQFHHRNQYVLQLIMLALLALNAFLLFFQPLSVLIFGGIVGFFTVIYLFVITPRHNKAKKILMPLIFVSAIAGVPFVLASDVKASSWLLALMFLLLIFQNYIGFSYFEHQKEVQNYIRRKKVNYLGAANLFLFIVFFAGSLEYNNLLAFVFCFISILNSIIVAHEHKFKPHFRWLMDGLLLLPAVLFFIV